MLTGAYNMSIRKPMILVIAGPNGSGKSTFTQYFEIIGEYTNEDDVSIFANALWSEDQILDLME